MSTRANVVLTESWSYKNTKGKVVNKSNKLYFYRHSDGYPEGTLPTLEIFMDWLNRGLIRNNVSQSAGWLIVIGNTEYKSGTNPEAKGWKVGAYEPTTGIHGDVEYVYVIDVLNKTLKHYTIYEYNNL